MSSIADETANLDATALAELVARGDVTPLELVDAAIERLERVNATLNAVVTPMYDEARATAKVGPHSGPFQGVPFLMKDFLAEVKGVRFTEGSQFLGDYVPEEDSELVKRFRRAGLQFIGKTNTPELAVGATTEPRRFGPTHNPWNVECMPGGSSGGAAAAAARVTLAMPSTMGSSAAASPAPEAAVPPPRPIRCTCVSRYFSFRRLAPYVRSSGDTPSSSSADSTWTSTARTATRRVNGRIVTSESLHIWQPQLAQAPLDAIHGAVVRFVVVTETVQDGVQEENAELGLL